MLTPQPLPPTPLVLPSLRVPDIVWVPIPPRRPVPVPVRVH